MKKQISLFILTSVLFACQPQKPSEETPGEEIYQYSVFTAMANKSYDGTLTAGRLKEKGDLGLGTFNGLNGEMIMMEGKVYQLRGDGILHQPDDSVLIPFAVAAFFNADIQFEKTGGDYNDLKSYIIERLPSLNLAYALQITGDFSYIRCGSADMQEKPYLKTLSKVLADRPVFEKRNATGTMVGFWFPEYMNYVNVPGLHLHFISDDKAIAGHVMEFAANELEIAIDVCSGLTIEFPETDSFLKGKFDLNEGYN